MKDRNGSTPAPPHGGNGGRGDRYTVNDLANVTAEDHLVGALIYQQDPDAIRKAAAMLPPDRITQPRVAQVYAALIGMADSAVPIELAGIVPFMVADGLPPSLGHETTGIVTELHGRVPIPGNWRYYLHLVQVAWIRLRIASHAISAYTDAPGVELDEQVRRWEAMCTEISAAVDALRGIGSGEQ